MKTKLFIFATALLLMGCSGETETSCNCVKTYYDYTQQWTYSKDCNDNGKILQSYTEGRFVVKEVVECK